MMNATPPSKGPWSVPNGLVLFPPGTSPGKKRRRLVFVAAYLMVAAALVWPVYPLFSGIRPLILSLPLSMAWVVGALFVGFLALLALYLTEEDLTEEDQDLETTSGSE